jgi:leader peptidase (prepilin peptidase) / N-methyltransferase
MIVSESGSTRFRIMLESDNEGGLNRIAASFASQHLYGRVSIAVLLAAAVAASLIAAPGAAGALGGFLAVLMAVVVLTDARFFIIPNELTGLALLSGLVDSALDSDFALEGVAMAIGRGAVLALAFLAVRVGYRNLRGREGLGLGDVKLFGVAGVWLDWSTIPLAVEIAALSALATYALRQAVLRKPIEATARLPFGVFLAPAIWLAWLIEVALLAPN